MNEDLNNENRTPAVLDSTDCLAAVAAFKSFKNLMFLLALICLATLQTIFWLNYTGHIQKTSCPCPQNAAEAPETAFLPAPVAPLAAIDFRAIVNAAKNPTCREIVPVIATLNYILFLAVVLFAVSLLITLKISIAGRLGGLNHISRAFLLALLLLVIIVPWQVCLPNTVVGAIYTPGELLCSQAVDCTALTFECVFYFGRFVGLWLIVFVLLLAAEIRSVRWSKAVIQRLGEPK